MTKKVNEKGFTLVELLLAMAFFSFILLFVTGGFIMVNRAYVKGLTVKLVQDEGRATMERLTREMRVSSLGDISIQPTCLTIGGGSYFWSEKVNASDSSPNAPYRLMWTDTLKCSDSPTAADGVDVLDDRVGVQQLQFQQISATGSQSIEISMVLSTAESDLIAAGGTSCATSNGSQYCDVVELTTVVSTR